MEYKIEKLVVCSTLNEITNYLMINRYRPKNVFNLTFEESAVKQFNINIKPEEWDKQLKEACKGLYETWHDITLSINDICNLEKLKKKIKTLIIEKADGEIYWHVTGGQRTIALAISELIKERKDDKLIYVEGNTEKLIVNDYKGSVSPETGLSYGDKSLTFQKVLNLTGFKTKNLKSTLTFKRNGEIVHTDQEFIEEHRFYQELYKIIELDSNRNTDEKPDSIEFEYENETYKDSFKNLLLQSNVIKNTKDKPNQRIEYITNLLEETVKNHIKLRESKYDILNSSEAKGDYPAGYIFEKITAHRIYDIIKNNSRLIGMETSLKTYFNDPEKENSYSIIDELDIVLLTDTGKIINFECKSGGMSSDNSKSTKYTTYRLSGVFGMPVLLSPLYECEINDKNSSNEFKNQLKAVRAAKSAELEVITIDKLNEENLRKVLL